MATGPFDVFRAELARIHAASNAGRSLSPFEATLVDLGSTHNIDAGLDALAWLGTGPIKLALAHGARKHLMARVDELIPVFVTSLSDRRRGPNAAHTVTFDLAVVAAADAAAHTGQGMTDLQMASLGNGVRLTWRWLNTDRTWVEVLVTDFETRRDDEVARYFRTLMTAFVSNACAGGVVTSWEAHELLAACRIEETHQIGALTCRVSRHPFLGRSIAELLEEGEFDSTGAMLRRRYRPSVHGTRLLDTNMRKLLLGDGAAGLARLTSPRADRIQRQLRPQQS